MTAKLKTRKEKRENQAASDLFNELLFKFIDFESKHTKEEYGFLVTEPSVTSKANELNNKWRVFVNHIRRNNKKTVKFKINVLEDALLKHIERHEHSAWSKYLVKVMDEAYGVNMPISTATEYVDLDKSVESVALTINQNLRNMYQIEIPEINFTKQMPEEISEMTNEDFEFLAGMLKKVFDGELEVYDLKTAMVLKFLNVKYSKKDYATMPDEPKMLIGENINGLTELLDYFFVPEGDKLMFNTGFTRNFIPQLNVQFVRKLYGPADALTDINYLEYKDANTYYRAYLESRDEADLNRLIAVLYRPHILPFGIWKRKRKYNPAKVEKRARHIAKLPIAKRFAIYLYYMACESFLRNGPIIIDGQEIDLTLLYETTLKEKQHAPKQTYEANTGLAGVALSLASTGIFGPIEQVYNQNLYDVLVLLYKQRIKYLNDLENLK